MSIREIQNFIYQRSQFTFIDGRTDQGMVVTRYNIALAKVDYYFIPSLKINEFQTAKKQAGMEIFNKFGQPVEISDILDAKRIN